jgi:hypothetical protein
MPFSADDCLTAYITCQPQDCHAEGQQWFTCLLLLCLLQDILLVTVDNPHATKNMLKEAFPWAKVMMDVGHVLFSRLGKCLDKSHPMYSE